MASTLADQLLQHVLSFSLKGVKLPADVGVLDPFHGPNAEEVRRIVTLFHRKYYNDNRTRVLMLGINPGGSARAARAFRSPTPSAAKATSAFRYRVCAPTSPAAISSTA